MTRILVVPLSKRYALVFAPEVVHDLAFIERKYHSLLRRQIRLHLATGPEGETRKRKALEVPAPSGAQWELRLGPHNRFRVFYEVELGAAIVTVLAIGVKDRNVLRIGGEEYGT